MGIKNGIVEDKVIGGIPLKVDIIQPSGIRNVRTLQIISPKGITVHNTGNTGVGAGDESHGNYLKNVEREDKVYVSWHFTVDGDSITQHLPLNEKGYHAGDGEYGYGNSSTIGIEIAESGDYLKNEANGIKLICYLMKEFKWDFDKIQPHRKYSSERKLCPRKILKSESTWIKDWNNFITTKVKVEFNRNSTIVAKPVVVDKLVPPVDKQYLVRVDISDLYIRGGAGGNSETRGFIKPGTYTIIETKGNWGKLKSGAGWICLDYVKKI